MARTLHDYTIHFTHAALSTDTACDLSPVHIGDYSRRGKGDSSRQCGQGFRLLNVDACHFYRVSAS